MRAHTLFGAGLTASILALSAGGCSDSERRTTSQSDAGAGGEGAVEAAGATGTGEAGGPDTGGTPSGGAPAAVGGASACPEGPEGEPPADYLAEFASGTRLEARYYASAGMPDVFAGFFDTELGEWCDFLVASDDTLRCLPRSVAVMSHHGYADAGCETDVVTLPVACSGGGAVYLRERLECLDKMAIRVAAPYAGALYRGSPDNCLSEGTAAAESYAFGDEVAPTTFVEGTLSDLPGVCRGGLRVVVGDDGARGPFEAFDIGTGAGCDHGSAGCTPQRRAFEEPGLFTDDSCETPAPQSYATWNDAETCRPPDFVRPMSDEDFWYRPGPLSDAELYSNLGGCVPAREREWIGSIYELGEAVPLADLAPLEAVQLGSGRLQATAAAEDATPLIAALGLADRFYAAELGQDCYLRELGDGTWRCIPTNILGGTLVDEYNDADCTQPLRRCTDPAACAGQIRWDDAASDDSCTSTPPTTGIWRLTEPATGYYRESPGFPCYASGDAPPDAWQVEAIDPADLPEATLEVAP